MKGLSVMFLAVIAGVLMVSCGNTVEPTAEVETIVETVKAEVLADASVTMELDGMVCSKGCVSAIQNGMASMPGIASCVVDYETKTALITYDSKLVNAEEMPSSLSTIYDGQYTGKIVESEVEEMEVVETTIETEV